MGSRLIFSNDTLDSIVQLPCIASTTLQGVLMNADTIIAAMASRN